MPHFPVGGSYVSVFLPATDIAVGYGSTQDTMRKSAISSLRVHIHSEKNRPYQDVANQKGLLSLFRGLQNLEKVEFRSTRAYLRPREIALFQGLSAALPHVHVVFDGLDDVMDRYLTRIYLEYDIDLTYDNRPHHLDNRVKTSPDFHSATDVLPYGISGLVVPQRIYNSGYRIRRNVTSAIVFPGGIHLHHALDGRYCDMPEYQAHPSAVDEH